MGGFFVVLCTRKVNFLYIIMARGPKKHLKRLCAPRSWMLAKSGGVFAPRPTPGPHKLRESIPTVLLELWMLFKSARLAKVSVSCTMLREDSLLTESLLRKPSSSYAR